MRLPDSWLWYSKCSIIKNTPFVACKTPLRKNFSTKLSAKQSFTPEILLEKHPQIKLVIDFTNTFKYYNGFLEFVKKGVQYVKIKMGGGGVIPSDKLFTMFANTVDRFLREYPENYLIAVHCTHGVNRTGYFIVRYMIERMGFDCKVALKHFFQCRGHALNRTPLIYDLLKRKPSGANAVMQKNTSAD